MEKSGWAGLGDRGDSSRREWGLAYTGTRLRLLLQ